MVEDFPPKSNGKSDENYPLLMVSGNGYSVRAPSATVVASVWNVATVNAKKSWKEKWPEIMSTCWFIFILMGTFCLVMNFFISVPYYHLFLVKCNDTKPASNVYIHHLVPFGSYIPFMIYSRFLSNMAVTYPYLRFNVYFMIDDTAQTAIASKYPLLDDKLLPFRQKKSHDDYNRRELMVFQRRYRNVNITVIPLSKYMATTPLKYTWKSIPTLYLPFFARVCSVWENGGIGFDMNLYNNMHNNYDIFDRKISAIFKEHNDGIRFNGYNEIFANCIESSEEVDMLIPLYDFVERILNETRQFFAVADMFTQPFSEKYGILPNNTTSNKTDVGKVVNVAMNISEKHIVTEIPTNSSSKIETTTSPAPKISDHENATMIKNTGKPIKDLQVVNTFGNLLEPNNLLTQGQTQFVIIYDIALVKEMFGDERRVGDKAQIATLQKGGKKKPYFPAYLSIDSEGIFISATSRQHPLLRDILTTGYKRVFPKLAIHDALNMQCTGSYRDAICNNIFVL